MHIVLTSPASVPPTVIVLGMRASVRKAMMKPTSANTAAAVSPSFSGSVNLKPARRRASRHDAVPRR